MTKKLSKTYESVIVEIKKRLKIIDKKLDQPRWKMSHSSREDYHTQYSTLTEILNIFGEKYD